MHSSLVICTASADDLAAIGALERRCFDVDAQTPRSLRYLLTRANACTLLARSDAALAGYVMLLFRRKSSIARLYSIAVDSDYRGRGVGEALVQAAQAAARMRGAHAIRLEVRQDNRASRQLFARLGYSDIQRLPGYYPGREAGDKEDGVRMSKHLLPAVEQRG